MFLYLSTNIPHSIITGNIILTGSPKGCSGEIWLTPKTVFSTSDYVLRSVTLQQILFQNFIRPYSKLGSSLALYPVPDRNNDIKIIKFLNSLNLSASL